MTNATEDEGAIQRSPAQRAGKPDENLPPWRETPLDHWSKEIDPVIMAGDEWASQDPGVDPGAKRIQEGLGGTRPGEMFMHPQHDTTYGLEEDVFTSENTSGRNDVDASNHQ
ncbi:DUF3905 domain-containing protein [Alicyclobacillus cycloheptanicus]|uniref:Uncharacterized protein n=1 Tax=Alicyclobacillus cycloheptanicus TaxID=1457 RepID=A0ABT9XG08_9BACL|nr:DUF3905 domain-containing protein [Alicyclobacillus cycloheptanicus]MDQ0189233.1 hypothetical protein [Alicyclobacillus cycloheptanicus]